MAPKPSLTPVPPVPPTPTVPQAVTPIYGGAPTARLSTPKDSGKSWLGKVKENILRANPVTAGFVGAGKSLQAVTGKYSSDQGVIGYPARELQETGKIIENVPAGFITFAGGMGIDAAEAVAASLTFGKYRPAYGTSIGMIKSMGHTLELLDGKREMEYWNALKNHQAISHLLLEDAGNIFFLGKGISSVFGGKGGLGQISTDNIIKGISKVSTDKSLPLLERYVPQFETVQRGGGLAGGFGEKAAAATEAGAETAAKRWGQLESGSLKISEAANYLAKRGEQLMQLPFKPYVAGFKYAGYSYRTGSLFGREWGAWGKSAAEKYKAQLVDYKATNPDAPMNDPFIKDLSKKIAFHENNAISSAVKKAINKAARMELFDKESTKRIILGIKTEPLYKKDINPDTGIEWGELTPAEEQAVIASINGRAQLVRWLSETLGMEPKQVAVIGRVNNRAEMHLGPDGATLGVDFLNHTSETPTMSQAQYERLSDAVERLTVQSAHATQRAVAGWGRKNNLSAEYLVPTPFVRNLEINLKKWGDKEALDFFNEARDKGVWDLPIDDIHRINTLMAIVEILPDEFALDASMYPASMRENVAFYRRVRTEIARELIGQAEGNPMPPYDQPAVGPDVNPLSRKSGRLTAASDLLSSVRAKIEKAKIKVDKINEQIAKIEAAHTASVDKLRTYDIIDAYLNGTSTKAIAKKYKMTVAEVEKFLKRKRIVVAFERLKASEANLRALEDTIGKKRSAMDEATATVELQKMQAQLEELRRIADDAQKELDSAQNVNEAARQMEEETNSRLAEEIYNLDDNLFDAETAFIEAGGDPTYFDIPDDILDPANAPMTVGSGRTYYEGLTNYIDEVLVPMAKEVSPAMEADIGRIKVIISESWLKAETNYYNSPTETIAAANQARVIQLGNLMRDLALNADTPGHMINNTIRNKANLDVLSGVTSPFEPPSSARKPLFKQEPLFIEGEELPFTAVPNSYNAGTAMHVYDSERIVTLDINADLGLELIRIADTVEAPALEKYKNGPGMMQKNGESRPRVVVDYSKSGTDAAFEVMFTDAGEPWWVTFQYENNLINIELQVRHDYPEWMNDTKEINGEKITTRKISVKQVVDIIEQHIAGWEAYKADPVNAAEPIYPHRLSKHLHGEPVEMVGPTRSKLEFDYPEYPAGKELNAANIEIWNKQVKAYDLELQRLQKFLDDVVGPRTVSEPTKTLSPVDRSSLPEVLDNASFEAQQKWKTEVIKEYSDGVEEFTTSAKKIITDSAIIALAKKQGEIIDPKTKEGKAFLNEVKTRVNEALESATNSRNEIPNRIRSINQGDPTTISEIKRFKEIARLLQKKIRYHTAEAKAMDIRSSYPKTRVTVENTLKLIYETELNRLNRVISKTEAAADTIFAPETRNAKKLTEPVVPEKTPTSQDPLSQLRKDAEASVGDPAPRIEDVIGAIELAPELEIQAKEAAVDPKALNKLRSDHEDVLALDRDIEAVSNPTLEDIKAYREQQLKFHNDEIVTQTGFAQATLGAGADKRTGNVAWNLSPVKGMPEWDWWFNGLDATQRQVIARDFFRTTEFKSGAFSGPRYVRKGQPIDAYADEANMTVDEFGAAFLDVVDKIQKSRRAVRNVKATEDAILGDEFTKINLEELRNYREQYPLSADEYGAIVARADHLSGAKADPVTVELLRPIADRPSAVVEDMAIVDPIIRQATYEADVLKAMAKDATAKMKKAERLSERIAAFDQWIKDSAQYKAEALDLIEKRKNAQAKRLVQARREAKLRELKNLKKTEELNIKRMEKTEVNLINSVPNQRLSLLPGSGPLKVALDENIMYPSGNFDIGYTNLEGEATSGQMRGPMYLPSGGNMLLAGGLKKEYSAEGTSGNIVLRNEHYRAGDRETIFSIRLIATKFGEDAGQMSANESFRAIVSLFGKKPVELLDEATITRLREESKTEALAYSKETATALYPELVKAMEEAGTPVPDGMGAYAPGVADPAANLKFMEDQIFGAKILSEMQNQGLKPVDPYAKIEKSMPFDEINETTFFLPEGMKEKIARQNKVVSPNLGSRLLAASHYITSKFKTTTLAFSVTWQLGDLISNAIISQMSGVDAVTLYKRMQQVGKAEYGSAKALVDPLTPMENGKTVQDQKLAEFLQAAPVQDVSLVAQERFVEQGLKAPEPKKSVLRRVGEEVGIPEKVLDRNPVRVSFKVNETINRIQRHAYFLELMDRAIKERFGSQQTLENIIDDGSWRTDQGIHDLMFEVADTANKWLGDFADLTMKERQYVTQFVPFYAWIKHIHKVFWALAAEHPQALGWYFYIGSLGFDPNEDPMNLRFGGTNLFGGVLSTNFLNPLSDVLNGPAAYLYGGDKRNALRGQGPVPRLVGALAFGTDTTTLSSLQRAPGAGGYSPSGNQLNSGLLNLAAGGSISESLGFAIQQFPLANRLIQASPVSGNIPGTRIALGPVATYKTGEARLSPQTNQRIEKWGGTPAAIGRLFSLPGIPYQTDKQIASVEQAARARLKTVETMKKRRANSKAP